MSQNCLSIESLWMMSKISFTDSAFNPSDSPFIILTSSLHTPKIFIEEFGDFLMPCHQQGLCINVLVQW